MKHLLFSSLVKEYKQAFPLPTKVPKQIKSINKKDLVKQVSFLAYKDIAQNTYKPFKSRTDYESDFMKNLVYQCDYIHSYVCSYITKDRLQFTSKKVKKSNIVEKLRDFQQHILYVDANHLSTTYVSTDGIRWILPLQQFFKFFSSCVRNFYMYAPCSRFQKELIRQIYFPVFNNAMINTLSQYLFSANFHYYSIKDLSFMLELVNTSWNLCKELNMDCLEFDLRFWYAYSQLDTNNKRDIMRAQDINYILEVLEIT